MLQAPNNIPVLGQQKAMAEVAINQAAQKLTLDLYTHAAKKMLEEPGVSPEYLEQLARDSQTAAQTFFETLAGVQFKKPESPG